jgi:transposase
MKRFIQGKDRTQGVLLPEQVDDYVTDENPVRVIDVFVDELDLATLGFKGVVPADTGRPAYHPADLLKLYIYGYLNRIHSSRRLEREAQRNIELMWLTGRLTPDFKTIANFRKDNGAGIRNVCRQFVLLCRNLDLFTQQLIAIDGSKFKAVNHRYRNFTKAKVLARMQQIEESTDRYLSMLDTTDRTEPPEACSTSARLQDKITILKQQMQQLKEIDVRLENTPDGQISLTDPDARSMKTRGTGIVGYNMQAAVDTTHHLIVAHEVTNIGSDRSQLANMSEKAREATGIEKLAVVADRGYFSGEEILACDQAGITAYVPKPLTSGAKSDGRFGKQDFVYMPDRDEYRCPAGHAMTRRFATVDKGLIINVYATPECRRCMVKPECTTGPERRIRRWEHEAVTEAMQERLSKVPEQMRLRRQTVEHPFGTLKAWMGATHFLTKTLGRVNTEMSLHVLAYNFKRLLSIMGTELMMKLARA